MHNAEEQVLKCVKTWNDIKELDLNLTVIFASEVCHIMIEHWELMTEDRVEDSSSRKSWLTQIIQTLALVIIHQPESIPSHWTQQDLDNINYLNNNRNKILP